MFSAVPPQLKAAIAAGVGLFIAFVGLVDTGFVRRLPDSANTTVLVELGIGGSIASWPTAVFVFGLILVSILVAQKVRGASLSSVGMTAALAILVECSVRAGPSEDINPYGWSLGYPTLSEQLISLSDLSPVSDILSEPGPGCPRWLSPRWCSRWC